MLEVINGKLIFPTVQGTFCVEIKKGDKLAPLDNTKKSSIALAEELEKLGYKTRIGLNQESGKWSVAILKELEKK